MLKVIASKAVYTVAILLITATFVLPLARVKADDLVVRKVTISDSKASASSVSNVFDFTVNSINPVGSIEFEYCTNNPFVGTACTAPSGLSVSGAVLSAQTGETGFSIHGSSTVNRLVITRPSTPTIATPVSYTFDNITNPNTPNTSTFVRISTFASVDGTGPRTDSGAVVFAITTGVQVSGYVPPYLTFCVGVTVALDCSIATGDQLDFGVFSSKNTSALSSEFSGATNDVAGFSTSVVGTTMTSGNNIISAMSTPGTSQPGTSQFGMNLRANSSPGVGANPAGPGTAVPASQMTTPNIFYFNNQVITNSPNSTDFSKFTASYIVNISGSQPAGVYSTTLTYIAVAAF